jgi:3',5'-cyclic AMP phosphodiesterase CpdA
MVVVLLFVFFASVLSATAQVVIAQLSDTHIGEKRAPHALDNLRRAVDMINRRHPDAVVLSGDIGENPEMWEDARNVLRRLKAPLYIAPGNHDVHTEDVERYRRVFGNDYYQFRVKGVRFVVIDSQLLGNFEQFDAHTPAPVPNYTRQQGERMLDWLDTLPTGQRTGRDERQRFENRGERRDDDRNNDMSGIVIGIQHIPVFRDDRVLHDPKPYWIISEPYRSREMEALRRLGIRHMLVGHWHVPDIFEQGGITWHVAPATSWLPWGGELGFAMHTITPDGDVRTEFVSIRSKP